MDIRDLFHSAGESLVRVRSRSALTVLGIVIGVAAIIVVMSLGHSAQSLILGQISGLGAETVVVQPGTGGFSVDVLYSRALTPRDLEALERRSNVPNLRSASPQVMVPFVIEHEGDRYRPMIVGGDAELYAEIYDVGIREGSLFDDVDVRQNAQVAVIGHEVADELFGDGQAVGRNIRIQNRPFRVVAVFAEKGSVLGFNMDQLVVIPWSTAQRITGDTHFSEIVIRADAAENVEQLVHDVRVTLRDTHDLRFDEDDDFSIQTQENLIGQIQSVISILTAFLGAVVAVSLVVGGIGIMNIMLVSVTERTKEIGLRKAVGAGQRDILNQFLLEAIILTMAGGLVGVLLGAGMAYGSAAIIAQFVDGWQAVVLPEAAVLGVAVSTAVGVAFGYYPARRAARLDPIEALRRE